MNRRGALKRGAAAMAAVAVSGPLGVAQDSPIKVAGRPVEIALTSTSPQTVRVTIQPLENGRVRHTASDGALVREDFESPVQRIRNLRGRATFRCGELQVHVSPGVVIQVEGQRGRLIQQLKTSPDSGELKFLLGDGAVFGLGQGGPQFNRAGNLDRMISGQEGFQLHTHGAKVPIQFAIGTSGWAMYVHSPLVAFDLRQQEGRLEPSDSAAVFPMDVFVIGATDPTAVMIEYANITGFPEMPPLWALGYQQSHRTLGTPEEIMREAKTFREKKLPCDAMIYLGTDFCPNGWNTHNGEFTWNAEAFPKPEKTIRELHDENFKVALHVVLEGQHLTGRVTDPCTASPLPTGRTPDGHWPPDRQVSCYWPAHKPLFEQNVDGWWPDQGDDFDARSRLARNRMYFEGSQMYRPNRRVYALHRNGYAGMQRFASFLWSGDVYSTWETLKTHVPVAINTGLSGIPYWGTDIGGFVPTQEYTGELFARWFQFAAFSPLFRSHGRDWRLHLPWGWSVGEIGYQETPSYHPDPRELHNPAIEPICKKYLQLRYQMMPYLYSAVKESCETGLPIIRALWLHYPAEAEAVLRGDEFLYSRDILVAPVVEKGATSRSLYLPKGIWYDFWTKEKVSGGRETNRRVDLETIPLYVRAGAVLPLGPVKQYTAEHVEGPLDVWVHPGTDGFFSLYEDDGDTFDFRRGEFMRLDLAWNDGRRALHIGLARGSKMLEPRKRNFVIHVCGESQKRDVVFEGRAVEIIL